MPTITFRHDVPLERTMDFELVYHDNLKLDLSEKEDIWVTPGSIFAWMFLDGEIAGESYGIPLAGCDEQIEGLTALTDSEKNTSVYCYSNTILPPFQRQGFAKILKAHWLGLVVGKGFDVVYGHARPGGSQALNVGFGAIFLADFLDWSATGEDYKLYRLALKAGS